MKKIVILLLSLITVFFTSWGIKAKTPINRPSNLEEEKETPWYENRYSSPQADDDWVLDPEIPLNYVPVPGEDELYMVVDDAGNVKEYRQRKQQPDGSWVWESVNPDIPDNYEKVEGMDNIYKVTNKDGSISYKKYIRNPDDTFAFVEVDKDGKPLDEGKSAETVPDNYVHVSGDTYAVYDDNNVRTGYRERVKNDNGEYIWKECAAPANEISNDGLSAILNNRNKTASIQNSGGIRTEGSTDSSSKTVNNSDGTYTVTENTTETETKDGYVITYTTTVKKTYTKDGQLLSTKKDGPYETSKTPAGNNAKADKSKISKSLDGELARVSGSVSFNKDKATQVFSKLNAARKSKNIATLNMNTGSEAYKLACIKAADMATFDYSSSTSPMYGTIENMVSLWKCSSSHPSENIWKAGTKSADDIHTRFQSNTGSNKIRMSNGYTEVGIAVVEKNGNTYVAEVFLK